MSILARETSGDEWIKVHLHIHTLDDPKDAVDYSAHQLLERAHLLGFGVLAITLHDAVFDRQKVFADAAAMVRLRALVRTSQEQTSLMPISRYVDGESEVIGEWPLATSVGEYTTIVGEIPAGASSGFDIPLLMELELRSGDAVLDNLFVQVLTRDPRLT
jgi:hypothetical protein